LTEVGSDHVFSTAWDRPEWLGDIPELPIEPNTPKVIEDDLSKTPPRQKAERQQQQQQIPAWLTEAADSAGQRHSRRNEFSGLQLSRSNSMPAAVEQASPEWQTQPTGWDSARKASADYHSATEELAQQVEKLTGNAERKLLHESLHSDDGKSFPVQLEADSSLIEPQLIDRAIESLYNENRHLKEEQELLRLSVENREIRSKNDRLKFELQTLNNNPNSTKPSPNSSKSSQNSIKSKKGSKSDDEEETKKFPGEDEPEPSNSTAPENSSDDKVEYELPPIWHLAFGKKSKVILVSLEAFGVTGFCGLDRCYMDQFTLGLLKAASFGGLGIWFLVDYAVIMWNALAEEDGINLLNYNANFRTDELFGIGQIQLAKWLALGALVLKFSSCLFRWAWVASRFRRLAGVP
jgi:hypothetical protein